MPTPADSTAKTRLPLPVADPGFDWPAALAAAIDDALVGAGLDGTIEAWNPGAEHLFGFSRDEALGMPVERLLAPDCREERRRVRERVLAGEFPGCRDSVCVRKDGSRVRVSIATSLARGPQGAPVGVAKVIRRRADDVPGGDTPEAIEQRYRLLLENMAEEVAYWELVREPDGRIRTWRLIDINPAALATWEKSAGEVLGRLSDEILPGATELLRPYVESAHAGGRAVRFEAWFPMLRRHRLLTCVPLGERFILTGTDITAQKQAAEALRLSEQRLQAIFEHSPNAITLMEYETGRIEAVNEAFVRTTGVPRGQIIGRTTLELDVIRDAERRASLYAELAASGRVSNWEFWFHPRSGPPRLGALSLELVTIAGRKYHLGTMLDITERARAEAQLRESRAMFEQLYERSPDAILLVDDAGLVARVNSAGERLFGATREELVGQGIGRFVPEGFRRRTPRWPRALVRSRAVRQLGIAAPFSAQRLDGTRFPAEVSLGPLEVAGRRMALAVVRDVSDRLAAEEQRQESLKREVLLREAHHRVKNNLQVVSSLLRLGLADSPLGAHALLESERRIAAMALVHDKFHGARRLGEIDFPDYVRELVDDVAAGFGAAARGIRIHASLAPARFDLDTAVPCGLLVNELVCNAFKHAFGPGADAMVEVRLERVGDAYRLSVEDNGRGLPEGAGDGRPEALGLRLSRSLARQLGGELTTVTPAGGGTCHAVEFRGPRDHTVRELQGGNGHGQRDDRRG